MAGYANSAITIDYLDQRNNLQTESLITNDSEVDLIETGAGFTANIEFGRSNIKLSLNVELEEDRLSFTIPEESIEEGERAQLVSLRLYPFLGAADETIEEGYLFLPDGSGALIRFEEEARATTPFRAPIYGQDAAFERNRTSVSQLNEPLSIAYPVYGIVHGEKQNGFAAILGEGKHHADIIAIQKVLQPTSIGRQHRIHSVMNTINQQVEVVMGLIRIKASDLPIPLSKSLYSCKTMRRAMLEWPMSIKRI